LTCDEHRVTLEKYLGYRDFPQSTRPLAEFLASQQPLESKSTGIGLDEDETL
jgi:hypothetical protein